MPLNSIALNAAIKAAFDKQALKNTNNDDPAVSRQEIADDLTAAFEAFVKCGSVQTTVSGTAVGGVVAGTGTGSIS